MLLKQTKRSEKQKLYMNPFLKKSGLKLFSKTAMSFYVLGTTYCFCKIRCVFLIRVFVFGEGRNLCDISTQTESHPNNILTATLGKRKQLSKKYDFVKCKRHISHVESVETIDRRMIFETMYQCYYVFDVF